MAVVLGPELDLTLRGIGEELKGRTQLDEPYVDKKTILRALREQNQVIMAMQTKILEMVEVEAGLQRTVDSLQEEVSSFRKTTEKVEEIDALLKVKIPLVDKMNETIEVHGQAIAQVRKDVSEQASALSSFKSETRSALAETKSDLMDVSRAVEEMPNTIRISSTQVRHSADEMGESSAHGPDDEGQELLADIIAQHEQRAFLHEENSRRIEEQMAEQFVRHEQITGRIDEDVTVLKEWKEEQSSVDLVTMRDRQETTARKVEAIEGDMENKMSSVDVTKRLDAQFKEIVNHLQMALETVENDEADFKAVTDSLNKMCQSLREKKADKSEISSLRKQFIENQVDGGDTIFPQGGATLDNEGIRSVLMNYPTKAMMDQVLNNKANSDVVIPRLERIEAMFKEVKEEMARHQSSFQQHAANDGYADGNFDLYNVPLGRREHTPRQHLKPLGDTAESNGYVASSPRLVESSSMGQSDSENIDSTTQRISPEWKPPMEAMMEKDIQVYDEDGDGTDYGGEHHHEVDDSKLTEKSGHKRLRQDLFAENEDPLAFPSSSIQTAPLSSFVSPTNKTLPSEEVVDEFLQAKSIRPNTCPSMSMRPSTAALKVITKRKSSLPEINRFRMKASSCVSIGGVHVHHHHKHHADKGGGLPRVLGGSQQSNKRALPVSETKTVNGKDGEFYIGSSNVSPNNLKVRTRNGEAVVAQQQ